MEILKICFIQLKLKLFPLVLQAPHLHLLFISDLSSFLLFFLLGLSQSATESKPFCGVQLFTGRSRSASLL